MKKKEWYKIHAPKLFNEIEIGETAALSPEKLNGRTIWVHYPELTQDFSKQHIKLKLRVNKVNGVHAYTELEEYEISRQFLHRVVRRRASKIEVVKDMNLKDAKIRIKIVAITLKKTNRTQETKIRKKISKKIEEWKDFTFYKFMIDVFGGKIQREIKSECGKIFPLRFLEIRKIVKV